MGVINNSKFKESIIKRENTLAHTALIGRDDHRAFGVDIDVGINLEKSLDHLIRGANVLKSVKRNCVLYSGVVCVEGYDIGDSHACKLLKHESAVKRLSTGALVLSSLVKHRHNNVDSASLTADSANNSLKILEMIIGAHRHGHAVHIIGYAVIEYVAKNVNVVTS